MVSSKKTNGHSKLIIGHLNSKEHDRLDLWHQCLGCHLRRQHGELALAEHLAVRHVKLADGAAQSCRDQSAKKLIATYLMQIMASFIHNWHKRKWSETS